MPANGRRDLIRRLKVNWQRGGGGGVKTAADFLEFTADDDSVLVPTRRTAITLEQHTTFVQNLDGSNLLSLTARSRYSSNTQQQV
jgi:hypothetical protein